MDVQNISGSDIVSQGLNVNSRILNENVNTEKQEPQENIVNPEKEKGNFIDIRA
ncbi:MAG: hypothetical protein JXN64_00920 [Spirochaetes bacterium]|nr:hypothetical protein [Spirochaetota bacterium]